MWQKTIKHSFWIIPFLSCALGYLFIHVLMRKNEVSTPTVVGKTVQQALKEASSFGLNIRFLREQEDSDLPEGVVIEQVPSPNKKVRFNQHLFVTLTKRPVAIQVPNVLGRSHSEILKQTKKLGIQVKTCWLDSCYPRDTCMAQAPPASNDFERETLLTYLSLGKNSLFIFPNFKKQCLKEIRSFLEKEGVKVEAFHIKHMSEDHCCESCVIIDQKPMAGAIIDMNKTLYVQFQVKEEK